MTLQLEQPDPTWCRLRVAAADLRDKVNALVSLLNAADGLRQRNPVMAQEIMGNARRLAKQLGLDGEKK